jgi:hypothetical protein
MDNQKEMFSRQKSFWTREEQDVLHTAETQAAIIQGRVEAGQTWNEIANVAISDILPKLTKLSAVENLSPNKLDEIKTAIRNLERVIPDSFEPKAKK